MDDSSKILKRARECRVEARALQLWLGSLIPANLVLVVGAGLLALLAGASALTDFGVISPKTAGLMAVTSSALTLVHNLLGCDPHQAECRRLRSAYDGLAARYEAVLVEPPERRLEVLREVEAQRVSVKGGAAAAASLRALQKAESAIPAASGAA